VRAIRDQELADRQDKAQSESSKTERPSLALA
jgi:hypothetical protein